MKMLLAGPGTGKTSWIKDIVRTNAEREFLVLSFTNATISGLLDDFAADKAHINKGNCMTLHAYALRVVGHSTECILNETDEAIAKKCAKKYEMTLEDFCRVFECITFDQMVEKATAFFRDNEVAAGGLINQNVILVVDEFQDFNRSERALIGQVAAHASETYILGDDDQCIYEFKNAGIEGIQSLYNDGTVEKIRHNNVCYRCPNEVVAAMDNLIRHNQRRVPKELKASGKSGYMRIRQFDTQAETGSAILTEIQRIRGANQDASIMVLSSNKFALRPVIEAFERTGLQYVSLLKQEVDQDLACLIWEVKCLLSSDVRQRMLYLLFMGQVKKLGFEIDRETLATSIKEAWQGVLNTAEQKSNLDPRFLELLATGINLADLGAEPRYSMIFPTTADTANLDADQVIDYLNARLSRGSHFDKHGVNVLSIHKSKGLQADYVFIVGVVEGMLPNALNGLDDIENQRRVLYVGMSRALSALYLVSTVKWDGAVTNKFDKSKFPYDWRSKSHVGAASSFISELREQP